MRRDVEKETNKVVRDNAVTDGKGKREGERGI